MEFVYTYIYVIDTKKFCTLIKVSSLFSTSLNPICIKLRNIPDGLGPWSTDLQNKRIRGEERALKSLLSKPALSLPKWGDLGGLQKNCKSIVVKV